MASNRRLRRLSRWGTSRIRWLGAVFGLGLVEVPAPPAAFVVLPFNIAAVAAAGAVVEFATGIGRGGKEDDTAIFPAERRLRSMFEKPKPPPVALEGLLWDGAGCIRVETIGPRRLPDTGFGDGGCGGDGESSRCGSAVVTWMWDCEEFLGLPRKKEPKIVVLEGGDSLWGCSIVIELWVVVVVAVVVDQSQE